MKSIHPLNGDGGLPHISRDARRSARRQLEDLSRLHEFGERLLEISDLDGRRHVT